MMKPIQILDFVEEWALLRRWRGSNQELLSDKLYKWWKNNTKKQWPGGRINCLCGQHNGFTYGCSHYVVIPAKPYLLFGGSYYVRLIIKKKKLTTYTLQYRVNGTSNVYFMEEA